MNKLFKKIFTFIFLGVPLFSSAQSSNKTGEFYQLRVYHFSNGEQQKLIEQYLQDAYLPALHRQRIKNIGVFTAISNDTTADKKLYLIVPLKSIQHVADLAVNLAKDKDYQASGKLYLNADYKMPPYARIENILLKSFPLAPALIQPKLAGPRNERVYELRSYESATENIFVNKVKMFNEGGEIALFKRLNFNAVFYASVIAGSRMPNLMYITSFENMADRDAHWKTFSADPEWKKLSSMPEYQNNVSKIDITFMRSTAYSDY
jgi:hypothetical protein